LRWSFGPPAPLSTTPTLLFFKTFAQIYLSPMPFYKTFFSMSTPDLPHQSLMRKEDPNFQSSRLIQAPKSFIEAVGQPILVNLALLDGEQIIGQR